MRQVAPTSPALHLGAGRVYLGMLAPLVVDFQQPELMLREANDIFELANALAIGPGLGQSPQAVALLQRAIASPCPVLFDADALNLLATHPVLCNHLAQRAAPTLLTPHPAEAARLLGVDIAHIQADRCAAAMAIARRCNAATLLKGCGSIIALPDGRWHINTTGKPLSATHCLEAQVPPSSPVIPTSPTPLPDRVGAKHRICSAPSWRR